MYKSDDSLLIGASAAANKSLCAELAIFREIQKEEFLIVCLSPVPSLQALRLARWKRIFGEQIGLSVGTLEG